MTNREAINLLEEVRVLDDSIYAYNKAYSDALEMALTALEAEEEWYESQEYPPKEQWIPVTERLPEEDEPFEVLCCDTHGNQLIAHPFKSEESDTGYCAESEECYLYNCIAWMPLPSPYKEDSE